MSIQPELKTVLKRLKLSPMLPTLPDRLAYARKEKLDYAQFLELVLSDEVERRDQKHVSNRLSAAGFEEECTLERFDWSAKIRIDKARLTELFGLHFIERHTRSSSILTSNRGVEEWMAVFDEPLLGQGALDRFCHRAHQFVIDGESYRKRTSPGSASPSKTGRKATT